MTPRPFQPNSLKSLKENQQKAQNVMSSAKAMGTSLREKIGVPLSTGVMNAQQKTYSLANKILNPGQTYVEPYLKNKGIGSGVAFGIGLGLDILAPGPGELERGLDLTTKTLNKLEGRTSVSKQFISDLTNSPDLKQAERDIIRKTLEDEGDTVDVPTFTNRVKSELLPLKTNSPMAFFGKSKGIQQTTKYENITLPDELRGPVTNYKENIYSSPIQTSAGQVHFGSGDSAKNYFAHTRIEDLPGELTTNKPLGLLKAPEGNIFAKGKGNNLYKNDGSTRRVIEIQSDLFQKGRLEDETKAVVSKELEKLYSKMSKEKGFFPDADMKRVMELERQAENTRTAELAKLEPYRNTWHERVIREEVKQAAKDGKTKLQFPTGETAMKIEGLGENSSWADISNHVDGDEAIISSPSDTLNPDQLKVGQRVARVDEGIGSFDPDNSWIITDVLGDGKFKAVPKNAWNDIQDMKRAYGLKGADKVEQTLNRYEESFDISGKVDTNNPIYKFYEKEVGKYLTNKYGAKVITDPQGVKWYQIDVKPEQGRLPIEAFGAFPLLMNNNQEE